MKYKEFIEYELEVDVAPFAGAWIEIRLTSAGVMHPYVAPFAGAWIEMELHSPCRQKMDSRSLRGSVD